MHQTNEAYQAMAAELREDADALTQKAARFRKEGLRSRLHVEDVAEMGNPGGWILLISCDVPIATYHPRP